MRIIAGKYRGITLNSPEGSNTRPTMDRSKEGLFNVINFYIQDAEFLDLFSGTGNIGIEALSRGAKNVDFIENDSKAITIIKQNLKKIKSEINPIKQDVKTYLQQTTKQYDYIFLDPPYEMDIANIQQIINLICDNDLLFADGQIIFEYNTKKAIELKNINVVKFKKYGISGFTFYEK